MNVNPFHFVVSDTPDLLPVDGSVAADGSTFGRLPWEASIEAVEATAARADGIVLAVPGPNGRPTGKYLESFLQRVFHILVAARKGKCRRIVVVTDLDRFSRCPENWHVDEKWRTRPTCEPLDIAAQLLEASVRELTRETGMLGTVLRLPRSASASVELHQAISDALGTERGSNPFFWTVRHIGKRPAAPVDVRPWREVLAPVNPVSSRSIRRVVVFGAGGPMAAALVPLLSDRYTLRLTDIRSLDEIRAAGYPHQPPGSPLPCAPSAPHEEMRCDVADPDAVDAACEGMDAVVNCSVIRYTDRDFAVNMAGCLNIAEAAVRHGIRRIVQTGPQLTGLDPVVGYHGEEEVPGNAPARPGANLYGHTKFLGNEILRIFAENHGLEVPVLVFNGFVTAQSRGRNPFETTFEESADAIRLALEAPGFPSPWEFITVCNDLPQGRFSSQRAAELLGWRTSDALEDTWRD